MAAEDGGDDAAISTLSAHTSSVPRCTAAVAVCRSLLSHSCATVPRERNRRGQTRVLPCCETHYKLSAHDDPPPSSASCRCVCVCVRARGYVCIAAMRLDRHGYTCTKRCRSVCARYPPLSIESRIALYTQPPAYVPTMTREQCRQEVHPNNDSIVCVCARARTHTQLSQKWVRCKPDTHN